MAYLYLFTVVVFVSAYRLGLLLEPDKRRWGVEVDFRIAVSEFCVRDPFLFSFQRLLAALLDSLATLQMLRILLCRVCSFFP